MENTEAGFYASLGVPFGADADDVKRSYRKMSLKYHPDRNRGDGAEEAKAIFQLVNNAFACISDAKQRQEYDGLFRTRCVLEQGVLTSQTLVQRPLDLVYSASLGTGQGSLDDQVAGGSPGRRTMKSSRLPSTRERQYDLPYEMSSSSPGRTPCLAHT